MLPLSVILVKGVGWAQAVAFILLSNRQATGLRASHATGSSLGPPGLLLAYRLTMLVWALLIGLRQVASKGRYVFVFFTVWNWWLLALFFLLGSASSLRAWLRRRRSGGGQAGEQQPQKGARRQRQQQQQQGLADPPADWLDRAVMALFATEMPGAIALDALTWLVLVPMLEAGAQSAASAEFWRAQYHNFESYNMTLAVDVLTWTVLVPMLLRDPAPARVQFWETRIFCFESYNQHGFNAAMMLGDLLLNNIPVTVLDAGWVALWISLYGVWSGFFYHHTGRFIYPFLDAHRPYAWASYVGLFATLWTTFLVSMGLVRAKSWLLCTRGRPAKPGGSRGEHAAALVSRPGMQAHVQELMTDVSLLGGDKLKVG